VRIYVAASSREVNRVRAAYAAVAASGWTLTHDWLTPLLANLDRGVRDTDLSRDDMVRYACADLDAIARADVLWVLAPRELTKGAWFETGYAYGIGVPIVVSGGCPSLFLSLADHVLDDDEDAPGAIGTIGPRRDA